MGCSVGTVKSQTSRGLAALRKVMDGDETPGYDAPTIRTLVPQEGGS
jgi:hypothetical protein